MSNRYINSQKETSIDTSKNNKTIIDQKENNINLNLIFQEINNAQMKIKIKPIIPALIKGTKKINYIEAILILILIMKMELI